MPALSGWPANYRERLSGVSCRLCTEGRPQETVSRLRFYASALCDAYLQKKGVQRGYTTVVWRGSHATEPTDLGEQEAVTFWLEVLRVARALQTHYRPLKMNYALLGNGEPHLHWLLAPRFADDVAPGRPLPASPYKPFDPDTLRADAIGLAKLLKETV